MNQLKAKFVASLQKGAFTAFKKAAGSVGVLLYSRVPEDDASLNFCEKVLSYWKDLDVQAHEFYRKQIALFKERGAAPNQKWRTENLLEDPVFMSKLDCDKRELRINLQKANPTSELVMFAHTLPFIPVSKVGKLWYTDSNGVRKSVPNSQLRPDSLKKIYMAVYQNLNATPSAAKLHQGYSITDLPSALIDDDEQRWNLNFTQIVKNMLANVKKGKSRSTKVEELFDMDTNMIWYSDENGLYRLIDGKRVSREEYFQKYDCGNTLALNQEKITKEECEDVADCILNAPEKLEKCLEKFSSYEMFDVSQKELSNMDPLMARKLLQVFHIGVTKSASLDKNRNSIELITPMGYNVWIEKVLDSPHLPKGWTDEFKNKIRASEHLQRYIKGIIEFVRKNPAILNSNVIDYPVKEEDNQMKMLNATQSEKPYRIDDYSWPYEISDEEGLRYTIGLLSNTSSSIFAPVASTLALPYAGTIVGDGIMVGGGLSTMAGGAAPSEDSLKESSLDSSTRLLGNILTDLQNSGLSFGDEQYKEIKKFIEEITRSEKRLKSMIKVLATLRNLQNFVKCYDNGKYTSHFTGKVLSLEEINNNRDLIAWLSYNIGDYETCLYKGVEFINAGTNQVLKAYHDLIQASSLNSKKKYTPLK
jgi:hypothetical protein